MSKNGSKIRIPSGYLRYACLFMSSDQNICSNCGVEIDHSD